MRYLLMILFTAIKLIAVDYIPEAYLGQVGQDLNFTHNEKQNCFNGLMSAPATTLQQPAMTTLQYRQLCQQAEQFNNYCYSHYGMNVRSFENLMYKSASDFVSVLLENERFTDTAIIELWDIYKYRQGYNSRKHHKVAIQEQQIQAELQKRKNVRDAVVRAQRDAEKKQEELRQQQVQSEQELRSQIAITVLRCQSLLQSDDFISSYQQQRTVALAQAAQEKFVKHQLCYDLDSQTAGLLNVYGVNVDVLQNVRANRMQHQLIGEVVQTYKKIARAVFEFGLKGSCLVPETISMAAVAHEVTMLDDVAVAAQLSDLADAMAEATLSVGRAVKHSVQGVVGFVIEYYQIPHKVGAMLQPIKSLAMFCGRVMAAPDHYCDHLQIYESLHEQMSEQAQQFSGAVAFCWNHFTQLSGQQKIEHVAEMVTDGVVCGRILGALSGLMRCAGNFDVMMAADILVEDFSFGQIIEEAISIAVPESKIAITMGELENGLKSLMETEIVVAQSGINFAEITEIPTFIESFHALNGVDSPSDKILVKQFDKALKRVSKKLDQNSIQHLTQLYAQRQVGNATVYAALDHFCNSTLGLMKCKTTGNMVLNISGGHLYGVCEAIERAGFVKIKKVITLPSGALHYFMEDVFTGRILEKTVFPKSWDAKKLCNAAWDLYEGRVVEFFEDTIDGGLIKNGIIDGIKMQMYCTVKTEENLIINKIITCYPVGLNV